MEFAEFSARAAEIETEPADLVIVDHVTDLLADADDDLAVLTRFVQGRIFPAWQSRTLDIGPSYCYEAIASAAGHNVSAADVEDRLAEIGDIGAVAASYEFGSQQTFAAFGSGDGSNLTVREVYATFDELAAIEGQGSQDTKVRNLQKLFNRTTPEEARYLARLVLSEMRIGVGEGAVRDAIAAAFDVPVEAVEHALQVSNDYGLVAETARDEGVAGLDAMELEIHRPVQAMLAQAGTVTDALDDWETAAVEWKFDGARVQIHHDEEGVSIYSRNMEDVTDPLPEIVEFVEEHATPPVIIDGEVVAIGDDGSPLPFQEILRRFRRKYDVEQARQDVATKLRAFDCLHADGEDLLDAPLEKRHDRLQEVMSGGVSASEASGGSEVAARGAKRAGPTSGVSRLWITDDPDEIESIDANALEAGHEGIMLKNPDSTYSPGRRGKNWLKRKPDVDTLDLVVTGAEWGEGRRASFLGTFLLSVKDGEEFETVGKVATGITDEELEDLTELLEPMIATQDGKEVTLQREVVFEVGYEEIQKSPTYSSGYALRFPRFLGVREDKDPDVADTLERVEELA